MPGGGKESLINSTLGYEGLDRAQIGRPSVGAKCFADWSEE